MLCNITALYGLPYLYDRCLLAAHFLHFTLMCQPLAPASIFRCPSTGHTFSVFIKEMLIPEESVTMRRHPLQTGILTCRAHTHGEHLCAAIAHGMPICTIVQHSYDPTPHVVQTTSNDRIALTTLLVLPANRNTFNANRRSILYPLNLDPSLSIVATCQSSSRTQSHICVSIAGVTS